MNILAISGGQLADYETLPFDKLNVDLTGKSRPNALFLPTAAFDSPGYCNSFREIYQKKLGCDVSFLLLDSGEVSQSRIEQQIAAADIIYVGGGNTLRMLNVWKRHGVDKLLLSLSDSNKVLSGLSAGAICWHEYGHSDSRKGPNSNYICVTSLGMTSGIFCPHFDSENREGDFPRLVRTKGIVGYGCDDLTAIWCTNGQDKIVKSLSKKAKVSVFTKEAGEIDKREYYEGEKII